jgi:hypothetical protein
MRHHKQWGSLQGRPRFDPDPEGDVAEQARQYLESTGRYPPGYLLVERLLSGLFNLIAALYRAIRR